MQPIQTRSIGLTAPLKTSVIAGVVYGLSAFVIGFGLGAIRTLFIAPRVGATNAVLFEAPVILYASWIISRRCVSHLDVAANVANRVWMGTTAFCALISCELVLSTLAFGRSAADFFADYASPAGAIGLAAQVLFAIFPYLQAAAPAGRTEHYGTES